jgi:branched-chain amino acid transport system permease protein
VASLLAVLFDGVAYGSLLFLIGLGLSVTLGLMNIVNLAHGAFAMMGGFLCVSLMRGPGVPFLATLPIVFGVMAAVGALLERVLYRRLYRSSPLDQVLLTMGLTFMAAGAASRVWGPSQQPVALPAFLRRQVSLFGLELGAYRLFLILLVAVAATGLGLLVSRTRWGAQLRAAVDNPAAAAGSGIDVHGLFTTSFALGSGLAGLGGALGIDVLGLDPSFATRYLPHFLMVVVVGGAGSFQGAWLAAILLGVSDVAANYYFPQVGAGGFVIYAWMVLLLILFPEGLFGRRR